MVAGGQYSLKHAPCLFDSADAIQRVNEPERAGRKSGLRFPEIVLNLVTVHMIAHAQIPVHCIDCGDIALVRGGQESDLRHQQDRRVQIRTAERGRESFDVIIQALSKMVA